MSTTSTFTLDIQQNWGRIFTDGTFPDIFYNAIWVGETLRSFMRFPNIALSRGTPIINAQINDLIYADSFSFEVCRGLICLEDSDNTDYPTSAEDVAARPLTSGVPWNPIPTMTLNQNCSTIDFSAELQKIINRPGWTPGNAVTMHLLDYGSDPSANRSWQANGLLPADWPTLEVAFEGDGAIDYLVVSDDFGALNWTRFLSQNADALSERYYCYLSAPGYSTVRLPISRFTANSYLLTDSRASAIIPAMIDVDGVNYATLISDRLAGTMRIAKSFRVGGADAVVENVISLPVSNAFFSGASRDDSITITGSGPLVFSPKHVAIDKITYKRQYENKTTIRIPTVDPFVKPGDFISHGGETWQAGQVSSWANARAISTEIAEL